MLFCFVSPVEPVSGNKLRTCWLPTCSLLGCTSPLVHEATSVVLLLGILLLILFAHQALDFWSLYRFQFLPEVCLWGHTWDQWLKWLWRWWLLWRTIPVLPVLKPAASCWLCLSLGFLVSLLSPFPAFPHPLSIFSQGAFLSLVWALQPSLGRSHSLEGCSQAFLSRS